MFEKVATFSNSQLCQKLSVSSFEMCNLQEKRMYLENIGLRLGCNAEKVIYNSWNYLFLKKIAIFSNPLF